MISLSTLLHSAHNKAVHSEQFFRRFFVAKKTATKIQPQNCRVTAALKVIPMEIALDILFWVFIVTFVPGNLMIFVFKKREASLSEMFWKGSFIVRDLDKYVEAKRVPQIKLLLTVGAFSFMAMVLVMLAGGLNNRF